jgi:hypothetical protein
METLKKPGNKTKTAAVPKEKKSKRKAAAAATNDSSVAAELKNREHGQERPAR